MNETAKFIVIFSAMGVMTILFWVVFAMVVRYLISVFKLIHQVKTVEPELWAALGHPTMFPMFHVSFNPFKGLYSQMRFCNWFLKGGDGAQAPETKTMVEKTRRLFRIGMIGFISMFVLFFIVIGGMALMMAMTGNG
jgi:hypothetical protein